MYSAVLEMGTWLSDISTKFYTSLDATSLLPSAWPTAGWCQVNNRYIFSQYRAHVMPPVEWLHILGAQRLQAAMDRLEALIATPRLAKNVRLYISSLVDIIKTDLHMLTVCIQDIALMVGKSNIFLFCCPQAVGGKFNELMKCCILTALFCFPLAGGWCRSVPPRSTCPTHQGPG